MLQSFLFLPSADSSDFVPQASIVTLADMVRQHCIDVGILDTDDFEDTPETFTVSISNFSLSDPDLVGFASRPSITVSILDDDRDVVLGFLEGSTLVNTSESVGMAVLCIGISFPAPELRFDSSIVVIVGTRRGTAGESMF